MISVYISIVLFSFQWLFKSYISKLLWTDFSITLPIRSSISELITLLITSRISELITSRITFSELSYATCTRINAVGTKVQFAFAVPVSGLIPDLKRSELQLSLVSPSFILSQAPSSRWALNSFQSGKTIRHNIIYPVITSFGNKTTFRGTQREYSSKPHKHSIVERTLVFKR